MIEHVDAPGVLLRNCRGQMSSNSCLVITVPNAFSIRSLLHTLRGYEKVATDHVAYYSMTNLRELAARAQFEVESMKWYRYSQPRRGLDRMLDLAVNPLLWCWPQLAEGMIALCRPVDGEWA